MSAVLAGFAWAVASPVGSSPDDNYHQASIWCPPPIEASGCPLVVDADGEVTGVYLPALVYLSETSPVVLAPCYAFENNESAACIGEYSAIDLVEAVHVDRGAYPGPYYRVMHLFVGEDVTRSVLVMRAFNVLLAVSLLGAVAAVSTGAVRRLTALATLGSFVPLGMFVIASVNPSSWSLVGVTAMWLSLHALFVAERRRTVIGASVLVVVSGGLAAASRADAAGYVVLLAVMITLIHAQTIRARPVRLIPPVLACAFGFAAFLSAAQSQFLSTGFGAKPGRLPSEVLLHNLTELPGLHAGAFGLNWGLGWLDTRMPAITYVGAFAVAAGLVLVGLGALDRLKAVALVVLGLALVALPIRLLHAGLHMIPEDVQPRYLLPLVPAFIGLALIGSPARTTVGLRLGQTFVVYTLLVTAHTFALHANIRRYVTGQDVKDLDLAADAEWWWSSGPGPTAAWMVGSLAFAVVALVLFGVAVRGDEPDRVDDVQVEEPPSPLGEGSGGSDYTDPRDRFVRARSKNQLDTDSTE